MRKSLSVKEKLAIIYALNDGTKNSSVCEQFGSSQSTVSVILKNQSAILDARENGITSAKRFRSCEKTDIDSIDGMVSREKFLNWNLNQWTNFKTFLPASL
ncbi:hypothetical protein T12_1086 [Trichinella patagoniensis]|uniref:HTH psq-type domain-containing protein n=1 Tax=Trichinella patagoniensis TaxID=990121 RepID=A0A0V0Z5X2_9BILA|nr:hypothetical protein T12_1086 [Trichinella patagoniensis]